MADREDPLPRGVEATLKSKPKSEINLRVGGNLRLLRATAGKSQKDVALHLNVSTGQYQKYESGDTNCSLEKLLVLSNYFGVDISEILRENSPKTQAFREEQASYRSDETDAIDDEVAAVAQLMNIFLRIPITLRRKVLDMLNELI